MNIATNSLVTFVSRVLYFLLQGLAAVILARWLGPEGRGTYALIIMVPHIAAMIALMGMNTSSAFYLSSHRASPSQVQGISFISIAFSGLAMVVVLVFLSPLYSRLYPEVPLSLFRWGLLTIPFIAWFNAILGIFQGKNQFIHFNLIFLLNPVLFTTLFCVFFLVLRLEVTGALLAWQLGFALVVLVGLRMLFQDGFQVKGLKTLSSGMLRYGRRVCLADLFGFLNYRLDIFLVGYFCTPRDVGYYSVAVVIAETLWFLGSAIATTHFPRFSSESVDQVRDLLYRAFRLVLWLTLIMTLALRLMDSFLLRILFGDVFVPSLPALHFLYPGVLMLSLAKVLSSFISARGRPDIPMWVSFVGVFCNFLLNLLFIPKMGIVGAGLASSLSYSLMFILEFLWCQRHYLISIADCFCFRGSDVKVWKGVLKPEKVAG